MWQVLAEQLFQKFCTNAVHVVHHAEDVDGFAPGVSAQMVYILQEGNILYIQDTDDGWSKVKENTMTNVARDAWVSEAALWSHWTNVEKLMTAERSQLLHIDAVSLIDTASLSADLQPLTRH
jgi:hypothetical protein